MSPIETAIETVEIKFRPAVPLTKEALAAEALHLLKEVGWMQGDSVGKSGYCATGALEVVAGLRTDPIRGIGYKKRAKDENIRHKVAEVALCLATTAGAIPDLDLVLYEVFNDYAPWEEENTPPLKSKEDLTDAQRRKAIKWLVGGEGPTEDVQSWNDHKGRTQEEVFGVFEQCATKN